MNIKKEGGFLVHPLVIFYFLVYFSFRRGHRNHHQQLQLTPTKPNMLQQWPYYVLLILIATGPWAE